ncbi:membrane traffic protein [Lithospermum erythrorhizon]|uniref:Membrane traffic protein n=1 Tax=Lithospermum erythrorhizon TaxID=34254 RepID=A0AAV3RCC1_LITER
MAEETSVSAAAPPVYTAAPLGHLMIPIVNKLQDIFSKVGSQSNIELPEVVVVGSQSSGKSSVLEALVGRDFLPRGAGICTRRPLVLQLVQDRTVKADYGEFGHLPDQRFYDFNEIRRMIQVETDREAGVNRGVSESVIRLKIVSPNVLDITLVDLPGITRVPVGDQPSDIETRIRNLIMQRIKNPNCLILAVTPGNADLANSDALQIAGIADPDGNRTIGVITKLDIMDKGTDARNFLLGKVVPLRLGYVGVVNRCQEAINKNLNIKDALMEEEKFFQNRPVYGDLSDRCGIPQLAKKLNQVLVQHIKTVLPGLKARISAQLVSVAKEHASYGEISESKAGQGALLLNILSKYTEAFSSMVEGKNEEMSTSELSGGARIHYIFQNIFVKCLEEVDPCEGLTDDDIRTAIQNSTGPKSALFVPQVPFEVLIRRQIARLMDPSLQCARFIYDELIKMSQRCMVNELQRFPVLRRCIDDVINKFLREGLKPSETMIGHIIEMEMDYINTSHPNFIGGSKAVEIAVHQVHRSRVATPIPRREPLDSDRAPASDRSLRSRAILARPANGIIPEQNTRPAGDVERAAPAGASTSSSWGISSIFGGSDSRVAAIENPTSQPFTEPIPSMEHALSMIQLREPPSVLRPSETHSDQETIEITVTKLLLRSYYDIVRKNIEDCVPKAIMHFLVNHTRRELHNVFIRKLYRDNMFEEMLQEPDEVALKRKRTREMLNVLQKAFQSLDELPLETEAIERGYSLSTDTTGLPRIRGFPTSSLHTSNGSSNHSGELQPPLFPNADSNGNTSRHHPSSNH